MLKNRFTFWTVKTIGAQIVLLTTPAFRTLMRDTGLARATMLTEGTAWRLRLTPKGRVVGFKHLTVTRQRGTGRPTS